MRGDVHHGLLRRKTRRIQDHLHAAVPALPVSLSGRTTMSSLSDVIRYVDIHIFKYACTEKPVHISQVYYSLWRRLLKLFWWLVVAYTMLVLISIYTYQFEDFPGYWRNFTGFTEEQYVLLPKSCISLSLTCWMVLFSLKLLGYFL